MGTNGDVRDVTNVVVLRCPGGYIAEVINQRWLKVPCREKRCRRVGAHEHIFDLLTGRMSNDVIANGHQPQGATAVESET